MTHFKLKQLLQRDQAETIYNFFTNAVPIAGRRRDPLSHYPMKHNNYYSLDDAIKICSEYIEAPNGRSKVKRKKVLETLLKLKDMTK